MKIIRSRREIKTEPVNSYEGLCADYQHYKQHFAANIQANSLSSLTPI